MKAVICDIDGVLIDTSLILKHIEDNKLTGDEKWEYFDNNANGLKAYPNRKMLEIIKLFWLKNFKIILLTGRSEKIKEETIKTLNNDFYLLTDCKPEFEIYMRKEDDYHLEPFEVKQRYLTELKKKYDIYCAFDDDEKNCKMFKENGILTFEVKQ